MVWLGYELKAQCYNCKKGKKENRNITLIYVENEPYRYYCNNELQDCVNIITLNKTLELEDKIQQLEKKLPCLKTPNSKSKEKPRLFNKELPHRL